MAIAGSFVRSSSPRHVWRRARGPPHISLELAPSRRDVTVVAGASQGQSLHPSGCVQLCVRESSKHTGIRKLAAVTLSCARCRRSYMDATTRERERLIERRPHDAPETLEPLSPSGKRRMLVIVNPYAATVSDRLRHLVVYALQGRFEVDAVDTQARGPATELCREAAHRGYDVEG